MELPAAVVFTVICFLGSSANQPVPLILFGNWYAATLTQV